MAITAPARTISNLSASRHLPQRGRAIMRRLAFTIALIALCTHPVEGNAQQKRDPVVIGPERSNCSDILDLQKLNYDPEQNVIRLDYLHPQRGAIYMAVIGWLQGFFSAQNLFDLSIDSDFTQGTRSIDWMNWMFSYCREHPTSTLFDAGIGLSNSLKRTYLETRRTVKNSDSRQP
jgi:hypothetical protein